MSEERVERRLAAIRAADVVGYSRLMGGNEEGTLAALKTLRRELVDPKVKEHHGRIVKTTGDGALVEFASVVDAVRCAVEVQREMIDRNAEYRSSGASHFASASISATSSSTRATFTGTASMSPPGSKPWRSRVSRVVRDQVRDKLDFAFDDRGEQQVKNISRPVRSYFVRLSDRRPASLAAAPDAAPLPDKPSIAVLPFANMSGDPEQEYFVDGMVEEIITALSRIRWLFVIARNSSFSYKGQSPDVKQVGRELGVRYVLEGSVRKAGNRVRITGQLIDAVTGPHLWADRFDGSLEDVFELQDKVASSVAGVIEPALQTAETARSAGRLTNDLTAYDLYLRAYAMSVSSARQIPEALRLLEQAIARDPRYGPALASAAVCCFRLHLDGRGEDPEAGRLKGADFARRAWKRPATIRASSGLPPSRWPILARTSAP
jgi:TolB-like protein